MQETWVWLKGWEDSLEKEMATHSSICAWRIPWTEEPGGLQSIVLQRVRHNWATKQQQHSYKEHYCSPFIEKIQINYLLNTNTI